MAELIIESGKHQGKRLVLSEAKIIVGRSPECHIRLASAEISKQHCLLRSGPQGISVTDLGSRNGTFVNDQPITQETPLKPGDRLRIGPMELRVPARKPARAPASTASKSRISDDEIAHWLADEPPDVDPGGETTTIITSDTALQPPDPAPPPVPEPARKPFRTVAEEGAEIIRRWREEHGGASQ